MALLCARTQNMYKVLSCGSNGNSQLGQGHDVDQNELHPVLVSLEQGKTASDLDQRPLKVSCGGNHTLILLQDGKVLACGDNTMGQCCIGEPKSIPIFTTIPPPSHFYDDDNMKDVQWKEISTGWEFSILVDTKDQIWSAGNGPNGELGLGEHTAKRLKLTRLQLNDDQKFVVIKVKSSIHSTIVVLQDRYTGKRKLFAWGNNKKGQLCELCKDAGGKFTNKLIYSPLEIEPTNLIVDFVMCRDFTVFKIHNSKGKIYELKGKDNFNIRRSLNGMEHDYNIQNMWSSIHFINGNKITSMGNNSHGQSYAFSDKVEIDMFSTGSEHGIIVDDNRTQVYTWGWGEHGNCGQHHKGEEDHNGVVFNYLNPLYTCPEDYTITSIQGGNATTWIVLQQHAE